ncbi:hypothetical protein DH86_00002107 [Scytalidium sp. 3C]|nr:hypothetical protein DH86_00002107 [Scytalidium sp. 3C]
MAGDDDVIVHVNVTEESPLLNDRAEDRQDHDGEEKRTPLSCAAGFRMILTPIDTLKTTLQAQGARGTHLLRQRIKANGIGSLWWGAIATAAATFVGHYPWFATVGVIFP